MDKKFLKVELQDGPGATGGISFTGETLENFLKEAGLSTDSSMEEINKALVECGILPILDFTWRMHETSYKTDEEKISMTVDQHLGCIFVGDIYVSIVIRDYGNERVKLAYSFDLYVAGEDTGYGYKTSEDGNILFPYDYVDGDDIWVSDLPENFEAFKKKAEKLITRYIAANDIRIERKNPYSLVEKASNPVRLNW